MNGRASCCTNLALWSAFALGSIGCGPTLAGRLDAGAADAPAFDGGALDAGAGEDAPAALDVGPDAPTDPAVDDASVEAFVFPHALGCTARTLALVTVRNTGTSTWTSALGYGLEAEGGSDPLHTEAARVLLPAGVSVAPGATHDFDVSLAAPGAAGRFVSDWRMARDGAPPFGASSSHDVDVYCDTTTPAAFDLAAVTIVSSPEVRDFAVTSTITSLSFTPGTIHIDHTARGTWPPVVIDPVDGTEQEATIWVFFHIGGQWYATGGERLRPSQTDKALPNPSWIGREWLYDPGRWGVMTGYVPSPGDLVGFMVVAGSTRSDDHVVVRERTGVVLVAFPPDDETTAFPPFAWQE